MMRTSFDGNDESRVDREYTGVRNTYNQWQLSNTSAASQVDALELSDLRDVPAIALANECYAIFAR